MYADTSPLMMKITLIGIELLASSLKNLERFYNKNFQFPQKP